MMNITGITMASYAQKKRKQAETTRNEGNNRMNEQRAQGKKACHVRMQKICPYPFSGEVQPSPPSSPFEVFIRRLSQIPIVHWIDEGIPVCTRRIHTRFIDVHTTGGERGGGRSHFNVSRFDTHIRDGIGHDAAASTSGSSVSGHFADVDHRCACNRFVIPMAREATGVTFFEPSIHIHFTPVVQTTMDEQHHGDADAAGGGEGDTHNHKKNNERVEKPAKQPPMTNRLRATAQVCLTMRRS
jgi:hypothetical protein